MKTIENIIEQEIKKHINDIDICSDLLVSSSENPKMYDGIISFAGEIVEDLIDINFKYLISMACSNYEEEPEQPEKIEGIEIDANISEEDSEMLKFIAG